LLLLSVALWLKPFGSSAIFAQIIQGLVVCWFCSVVVVVVLACRRFAHAGGGARRWWILLLRL
jgi:hypothetical protein